MPCSCKSGRRTALQLIDKKQVNGITYSFDFAPIEPLGWKEGDSSAVVLDIPSAGMEDSRKLSYASLPSEKIIRFTTRIGDQASLFKKRLAALEQGEFVEVTYPDGQFALVRDGRPALLLSNGVGIAAIRALIKAFEENDGGIHHMSQINVDRSGAIYQEEMEAIAARRKGFRSFYTGNRHLFYDRLDEELRYLMFAAGVMPCFYVVGSEGFVEDVKLYLYRMGFTGNDIRTDQQGCSCGSTKLRRVKVTDRVDFDRPIRLR